MWYVVPCIVYYEGMCIYYMYICVLPCVYAVCACVVCFVGYVIVWELCANTVLAVCMWWGGVEGH